LSQSSFAYFGLQVDNCRKQQKPEYLQLLAELNIANFIYSTVEVGVLGHYLPDSVNALKDVVSFMDQDLYFQKPVLELF